MEIENTTLVGNYSQKLHLWTHHYGTSNGRRLTIAENGNVGIGRTDPDYLLDVNGDTRVGNVLYVGKNTNNETAKTIYFGGTYGDNAYDHCVIERRVWSTSTEKQELLLFSGNDGETSAGPDRIRLKGAQILFDTLNNSTDRTTENTKMIIKANGNVGIGTTSPHCPLQVNGKGGNISSANRIHWAYYNYHSGGHTNGAELVGPTNSSWSQIGIYSEWDIATAHQFVSHGGTISSSDERIKKNIVDADDAECLETLRLLKPKKYGYKDVVEKGEEPVWGFIAQEVANVLQHATQLRQDVLPNIYELANVSSSNVITFTNFNTSNLESNATTLIRTKGIDGKDHDIHLVEVVDEHTIRVEEDLSLWTGSVDAEGNVITQIETTTLTPEEYEALEDKTGCVANISGYQNANVVISVEEYNGVEDTTGYEEVIENYTKTATIYPGTQLFVYGQEVNDFVFLKKDAIWTVATSALQEVDRQLQAEKAGVQQIDRIQQQHDAQISDLESQLQEQASENRALRTALESLESRLESLESVVD